MANKKLLQLVLVRTCLCLINGMNMHKIGVKIFNLKNTMSTSC